MTKTSRSRERYLLQKHFNTKSAQHIPSHLDQFGCRDSDLSDEDLGFIARYVRTIDRLILGGSDIGETGLENLKSFQAVKYLDLRGLPLNDSNVRRILHLHNLEYLYVKYTHLTAEEITLILSAFPALQTLVAEVPESERAHIQVWKAQYPKIELRIGIKH